MSGAIPNSVIAEIGFIGRSGGGLKGLAGFRKGHHSVPDAVNGTTTAFLGKICEGELAAQAEALFQQVRTGLGYKRKQVSLSVVSPRATLAAKDFAVEILYALEPQDPGQFTVTTELREVRSAELLRTAEFGAIFAGKFSEILFGLRKGVAVEAVIDAIEALDGEGGLKVDYPSDCRTCTISVAGVAATVRCTGAALEIGFPRAGGPAELVEAFAEVREAFQISRVLRTMLG
ncbi:MAG: hypothetical protein HZC55_01610 [Verrucomicrobia bacterium]|jgi:hypothetical protein|nr:hypothetical protein [Verrucomicrobiota bacterium]